MVAKRLTFVSLFFYLGFNTNPKNGRVKALSKACLDRTYSINNIQISLKIFIDALFHSFFIMQLLINFIKKYKKAIKIP
jgi:hypothetical protein